MSAVGVAEEKPQATVFGQPRGLVTIASTELWERISFHGMQVLLVLYMVDELLLPGHVEHIVGFGAVRGAIEAVRGPLSVQPLASQIFGLYVGLVYLMPVIGGFIGDRFLGRTRAVALGAVLMTAGHFCMAFEQSFLLAMLLLILGAGTLRGNLAPQLGELYPKEDRRRGLAFQLYGSAVNLGAFIAPLITGELQQRLNWHYAFGFAGVGMAIGLVVYLAGARDLPKETPRAAQAPRPPMTAREKRAVVYLLALVPVGSLFWIAQTQVWNVYNLWVRDHVDLRFGNWTMPIPWLQSLDGLAPFLWLPAVLALWRWQAKRGREPDEFVKLALGCFIFGGSTLWLAAASYMAGDGRASLLWSLAFHMGSNLGWVFFAPTVIALYSRVAPAQVNATLVGGYYLAIFMGSIVSGWLGGLYETLPAVTFWTLHAGLCALGGVLFLLCGAAMRRSL
jgi:proton-dependent oligopeptide transporter, POT family